MNALPSPSSGRGSRAPLSSSCPAGEAGGGRRGGQGGGVLQGGARAPRELNADEQQELRRKINSRERKRMQDLNVAMDALREVMVPYSSSSSSPSPGVAAGVAGRRLSKISTLVLACNYILLLGSSLAEMRRLLGELSVGVGVGGTVPRLLLAGGWPLLGAPAGHFLSRLSRSWHPCRPSAPSCPPRLPPSPRRSPPHGGEEGGGGGAGVPLRGV